VAWQDRDYNRGGFGGAGDYLANPAGILAFSVPFGNWLGVRVRLHFWLLLSFLFIVARLFTGGSLLVVALDMALMTAALLLHDFGHRAFAGWVGGELNEFMLWPVGGMIFPTVPPSPWPTFVGYVGGITVNLFLAIGSYGAIYLMTGLYPDLPVRDPLMSLGGFLPKTSAPPGELLFVCLYNFFYLNWGLVIGNLLPYFWFDGGFLWRSILHPFAGARAALNITCICGMILAVPMFALSLVSQNLLGLIMWALLFSSAYTARTQMASESEEYAVSYGGGSGVIGRIKSGRWPAKSMARAQAKRRRDEQKIDAILAKVSAHGMHSLTWWEKRTLKKGSQRLR
jgi:Zn-dependent protease